MIAVTKSAESPQDGMMTMMVVMMWWHDGGDDGGGGDSGDVGVTLVVVVGTVLYIAWSMFRSIGLTDFRNYYPRCLNTQCDTYKISITV